MPTRIRRVVSGLDAQGASRWARDERVAPALEDAANGLTVTDLWRSAQLPVDLREVGVPRGFETWPDRAGVVLRMVEVAPETSYSWEREARMHASDTVDLVVVISGEIWSYQADEPEGQLLKPGDVLVQRGTRHAWRNLSSAPCVFACVLLGAEKPPL
jgi:hypothetical protein